MQGEKHSLLFFSYLHASLTVAGSIDVGYNRASPKMKSINYSKLRKESTDAISLFIDTRPLDCDLRFNYNRVDKVLQINT